MPLASLSRPGIGWLVSSLACGALVGVVTLFTMAPEALAASPSSAAAPGLSPVHPGPDGYFAYTLAPGGMATATLVVHDLAGSPAHYLVYVSKATTSPVSGIAYGQPEGHPTGVGAWFHPALTTVHLLPKGAVAVRVQVTVPRGTRSGDYVAAVAAQNPNPAETAGPKAGGRSVRFLVTTRTIVAVVVHVPGPTAAAARFGRPSIGLQQLRRQVFTIPIHDTGDALMKPYLAGHLAPCSGARVVLRVARQLDTFVPHTAIDYPWYLNNQVLPAGCYRVALTLRMSERAPLLASYYGRLQVGPAAAKTHRATGNPRLVVGSALPAWVLAAAAGAVLLFFLTGGWLFRARIERRRLLQCPGETTES